MNYDPFLILHITFICLFRGDTPQMPKNLTANVPDAQPFSMSKRPVDSTKINNVLVAFSTMGDFFSNRSQEFGSWYFDALETVFNNHAFTDVLEIRQLLDEVDKELSKIVRTVNIKGIDVESCQKSQYFVTGMRKNFYLPLSKQWAFFSCFCTNFNWKCSSRIFGSTIVTKIVLPKK